MLRLTRNIIKPALHAASCRLAPSSLLSQRRFFSSDLPDHIVQGMPALSPTMEVGNISWRMKEGDEFVAGDVLAEIETDKASIDFVTEDDGFIGKLLVPDGAQEVPVGSPILVVVDSAEDVAAFKDFLAEVGDTTMTAAKATPEPAATPVSPPAAAPTPPPPPAAPTPPAAPPIAATPTSETSPVSPMLESLRSTQSSYAKKYGTTGFSN